MSPYAAALRRQREALGISRERAAEESGIGLRTIAALENGETNAYLPTLRTLSATYRRLRAGRSC